MGYSKEEKDWNGNEIIQHYDNAGNKIGHTKIEKDLFGRKIFKHYDKPGKDDSGIWILIAIVLVVATVLGIFSSPFIFVDPNFAPFQFKWLENTNVWVFCISFWVLIGSVIAIFMVLAKNNPSEEKNEFLVSNGLVPLMFLLAAFPVVVSYLIKAKTLDHFLVASISILSLLLLGVILYFRKTTKAIYPIVTFIISSFFTVLFLNQSYLGNKVQTISETTAVSDSSALLVDPPTNVSPTLVDPIYKSDTVVIKLDDSQIGTANQEDIAVEDIVVPSVDQGSTVEAPILNDVDKVYQEVQIDAEFPGGNAAWSKYIQRVIDQNIDALQNDGKSGAVVILFIVDKEGVVSDIHVMPCSTAGVAKCLDSGSKLAEVAVNAIKEGPKWKPAVQNGRNVKAYRRQLVTFKLAED